MQPQNTDPGGTTIEDNEQLTHPFYPHDENDLERFSANGDIARYDPVPYLISEHNDIQHATSPTAPSLDSPTQHTDNQTEESTA